MTHKISGLIMLVGSLIFFSGLTRPALAELLTAPPARQRQLAGLYINDWRFANLGMGVGSLIIGIGIMIFVFGVHRQTQNWMYRLLAYVVGITGIIATSCWAYVSFGRVSSTVVTLALSGSYETAFHLFTILIIVSIVLLGFVCALSYSRIGGVLIMAIEVGTVLISLVLGNEVIPAVHAPIVFLTGIILMIVP